MYKFSIDDRVKVLERSDLFSDFWNETGTIIDRVPSSYKREVPYILYEVKFDNQDLVARSLMFEESHLKRTKNGKTKG